MGYQSIEEIISYCEKEKLEFWQAVQRDDIVEREVTEEESKEKMCQVLDAMIAATDDYDPEIESASGLVGGDGAKMRKYCASQDHLCGDFIGNVIAGAIEMGESNACMKRIVAAPTAGASGVMPAVLITYMNQYHISKDKMIEALYVAGGIGQVIAERAFIAGASGGCQAEIGSASAMAAGALVYLKGGSNNMIANASAMALKNLLGLVCDPVAGLVEVPCVKRNVVGAVNAAAAADMALAGIESRIPADQVIDAMKEIGEHMNPDYKETSRGGIANTKAGREIEKNL